VFYDNEKIMMMCLRVWFFALTLAAEHFFPQLTGIWTRAVHWYGTMKFWVMIHRAGLGR